MKAILAGVAMMALCAVAGAGSKFTSEVYINQTSKYAQGSLGSARNSADTNQYIGCSTSNDYVYCSARNAAGLWVHCDTYSSGMAATAKSIDSSSHITFYWTGGSSTSGACSSLNVAHNSGYAPKEP